MKEKEEKITSLTIKLTEETQTDVIKIIDFGRVLSRPLLCFPFHLHFSFESFRRVIGA